MTEDRNGNESGGGLARGVLVIVVVGLALGVGFNSLLLAAGPKQGGLPWVKQEVKLKSLEDVLGDQPATPDATPAPQPAESEPTESTTAPTVQIESTPEATDLAIANKTTKKATKAKPAAPATGASKTATPAPAAATKTPPAETPAAPKVVLPVIPVTREPLEAQYATIKKFWDADSALFVDARTPAEYAEGHIPGAVNLDFDDVFKDPDTVKKFDSSKGRVIVTYCGGGDCELSKSLAISFIDAGHKRVLVFMGGLPGWKEGGNAVATGKTPGR